MAAVRAKGAETRRARRAAPAIVFMDDEQWVDLARARGVRLPAPGVPITPAAMERWLRRLGMTTRVYLDWTGARTLAQFGAANPGWGLRPWVGLLLEGIREDVSALPRAVAIRSRSGLCARPG